MLSDVDKSRQNIFSVEVYILFWWKHYRSDSTKRKLLEMISDALAFRERDGELSASFGLSQPVNNDLSSRLITAFCSEQYHTLHLLPLPLYLFRFPQRYVQRRKFPREAIWAVGGKRVARIDIRLLKILCARYARKINGEETYGVFGCALLTTMSRCIYPICGSTANIASLSRH